MTALAATPPAASLPAAGGRGAPGRGREGGAVLLDALVATAVLSLAVSYGKLYLFHVVLVVASVRGVLRPGRRSMFASPPRISRYPLAMVGTLAWFAIGLAWSRDRGLTMQFLFYLAMGASICWAVVNHVRLDACRLDRVFAVAWWWFTLDVAVGVLESLTPLRLPVSPYSSFVAASDVLEDASLDTLAYLEGCPTGFHWNPNNYAVVMVMLLPFTLLHRRLYVRWVGSAVLVGLVLSSASRGCLCGVAAVVCLAPAFGKAAAWLVRGGVVATAAAALLMLAPHAETLGVQKLTEAAGTVTAVHAYLLERGDDQDSISMRRHLINNGMVALAESRWLGIGGGADKAVQKSYGGAVGELASMHNVWVELLVCGGVPFFLLLVVWYARLTHELYLTSKRLPAACRLRYYTGAASLSLIGFVPSAVSASSTIYMLPMYLLLAFSMATVNVARAARAARCTPLGPAGTSPPPQRLAAA